MNETLAILVGGGPAPGINGVIGSAAIEAIEHGVRVIGLYDGYAHIAQGDISHTVELGVEDVARIHFTGGSILRTSRTNPGKDAATTDRCVDALLRLGVRYLVCIGGDDTTYGALKIAERSQGRIGVATVPKTIDNDLPLPDNAPTFGFETARAVGTNIIESLLEDARTTARWYIAITMGRTSGSLALGMCKASGAPLAVIPEEFSSDGFSLDLVVDTIAGSIIKRRADGHEDGVAVVAEGVAELLSADQVDRLEGLERDAYGHIRLADLPLGTVLRNGVKKRLAAIGVSATIVNKDIGYELRCAKPVPFDIEYTRTLGYGAVQYLLSGGSGAMIALSGGRVTPLTLAELQDPQTGRVRIRRVDITNESYRVARFYMARLEPGDVEEPRLSRIAATTSLTPAAFAEQFAATARRGAVADALAR
jgi:6-phosphofructokinase